MRFILNLVYFSAKLCQNTLSDLGLLGGFTHLGLHSQDNKLIVKKSPNFAWLELLYPDVSEFYIPFPEVQWMNSSWQWYQKGLEVKTLNLTIHPFYGTYFPTRFDHLKLFDKWLKKYEGAKDNAINIGVGSGVLSFQLIQNGFENIYSSDTNKNAIIGVSQECKRLGYEDKITLNHADLFENCDVEADVIVFHPPLLLEKNDLGEELFPRFFKQALEHLSPDGKIVLIFSNIEEESTHPIIEELQNNKRFRKELHLKRDVRASSRRTKRRDSKDKEKVELWVLAPKEKR